MRIIFMGTPDFAVATLDILVKNGYDIVGVITAPDRKAGRGRKISESAVKKYAVANGLHVLQPTNLKNVDFLRELKALEADLQIVVAFRMLPVAVWDMPPMGTVNLHASLLPQYRGAAPINHAIINGEKETGATTFFIRHEIDTGDLLLQAKVAIRPDESAGELHDELMTKGAELILRTVKAIEEKTIEAIPQQMEGELISAPKIFKEDCQIDWSLNTETVYNLIRGLSPYPAAFTYLHEKVLKVYRADKVIRPHTSPVGLYTTNGKDELRYFCNDGYLLLHEVQLEGKKRMSVPDFLRGYNWPG